MPRFNVLQKLLSFFVIATFGLNLGLMVAGVYIAAIPFILFSEIVILALTFLPKKKTMVRRHTPLATIRVTNAVKRVQPQRNLGTKPDNGMWKWTQENLSKAFQYTKPRAAAALRTTRDTTQEMWSTFKADTQQGRADFMEGVKSFFSSAWEAIWKWVKAILADLFGKLFKLITGGYGTWAALLFWSIATLMLNYILFFGGNVLDEDEEEGLARGLSLVFVVLFLSTLITGGREIHKRM